MSHAFPRRQVKFATHLDEGFVFYACRATVLYCAGRLIGILISLETATVTIGSRWQEWQTPLLPDADYVTTDATHRICQGQVALRH